MIRVSSRQLSLWGIIAIVSIYLLIVAVLGYAIATSSKFVILAIAGVFLLAFTFKRPDIVLMLYLILSVMDFQAINAGYGFTAQNIILVILLVSIFLGNPSWENFFIRSGKSQVIWYLLIAVFILWTFAFPSIGLSLTDRLIELKRRFVFLLTIFLAFSINFEKVGGMRRAVQMVELIALIIAGYSILGFRTVSSVSIMDWQILQPNLISYWIGTSIGPTLSLGATLLLSELLALRRTEVFSILWRIVAIGFISVAVILTFERGMALLLVASLLVTGGIFAFRKKRINRFFIILLIVTAITIVPLTKTSIGSQLMSRWQSIFQSSNVQDLQSVVNTRYGALLTNAWDEVLSVFPLGIGLFNGSGLGFSPHNQYVQWLLEIGLPGLLVMLLLMASWGWFLWNRIRLGNNNYRLCVSSALFGTLMGMLVYIYFDDYFLTNWLYLYLFLLGLVWKEAHLDKTNPVTVNPLPNN